MLHTFLTEHRSDILALVKAKINAQRPSIISTVEYERGITLFYEELIRILMANDPDQPKAAIEETDDAVAAAKDSAVAHGRESVRLGYSVSDLVHSYGAVCQAVTEYASQYQEHITANDFHGLNFAIDAAVAEAAGGYIEVTSARQDDDYALELRSLVHELRNPLSNAILALEMIRTGEVGLSGPTGQLLTRALERMRVLIEATLEQVRGQALQLSCIALDLPALVADAVQFCHYNAQVRGVTIVLDLPPHLVVEADPQHLSGAVLNLIQNAIKFTRPGSSVQIRVRKSESALWLEVEDQCGGLPSNKVDDLFKPYVQLSADRSGVGLGLAIAKRAIEAHQGRIVVKNKPHVGCVFTIELPPQVTH